MKAWTLTAAALAALTACTDDGPDVAAVPDAVPGDPAVYAPDGWPLQIGDRVSWREIARLHEQFQLPGLPRAGESDFTAVSSAWRAYTALNLVGDRVYAALFHKDPKLGDYPDVYLGHFPTRFRESIRRQEPDLPPEYHGKVEYYTRPAPPPPDPNEPYVMKTVVIDPGMWDADGRVLKLDPDYVPEPPDPLRWPDYPVRRK